MPRGRPRKEKWEPSTFPPGWTMFLRFSQPPYDAWLHRSILEPVSVNALTSLEGNGAEGLLGFPPEMRLLLLFYWKYNVEGFTEQITGRDLRVLFKGHQPVMPEEMEVAIKEGKVRKFFSEFAKSIPPTWLQFVPGKSLGDRIVEQRVRVRTRPSGAEVAPQPVRVRTRNIDIQAEAERIRRTYGGKSRFRRRD